MSDISALANLFTVAFSTFKAELGDIKSSDLANLAKSNAKFRELCLDLATRAAAIYDAQDASETRFFTNTGRAFISAWREYETQYSKRIFAVALQHAYGQPIVVPNSFLGQNLQSQYDDLRAQEGSNRIELNFLFSGFVCEVFPEVTDSIFEKYFSESASSRIEFTDQLKEGLNDWNSFKQLTGFDLYGSIRRFRSVAFVNIPSDLAITQFGKEKAQLITQLEHSHKAFVFGNFYAALALMRSTMEAALKFHKFRGVYNPKGKQGLIQWQIANCISLPDSDLRKKLDSLRRQANRIVHADTTTSDFNLERQVGDYLTNLQQLIQAAPLGKPDNTSTDMS